MKKNHRLILCSLVTVILSLILMNLAHFVGTVPDAVIRIVGIIVMTAAGVSIFFTVRTAVSSDKKENSKEEE